LPLLAQPSPRVFHRPNLVWVLRKPRGKPPHRLGRGSIFQTSGQSHDVRQPLLPIPHRHVDRPVPPPIASALGHLAPSLSPQHRRRRHNLRSLEAAGPLDLPHRRLRRALYPLQPQSGKLVPKHDGSDGQNFKSLRPQFQTYTNYVRWRQGLLANRPILFPARSAQTERRSQCQV
jgi:hypothetical protein